MLIYDTRSTSFENVCADLVTKFLHQAGRADVGQWQSLDIRDKPELVTRELLHVSLNYEVSPSLERLQVEVAPNLPWAEDHFAERVGGVPLNPGVQYANWPYYKGNVEQHKGQGHFSHTYMERFWPKRATEDGVMPPREGLVVPRHGIRYYYGDLGDVVQQLRMSPMTRQAYLPVWFPEDTGAVHRERVPCTLGYHFIIRRGKLDCTYYIRSCDFLRHFRDDVYLASRLMQWICDRLNEDVEEYEPLLRPGNMLMHITSFHVFEGDKAQLERLEDA